MARVEWTGTVQHPDARDLSEYLVHLTRSRQELEAILRDGVIEARAPHGLALHTAPDVSSQYTVSFTETPVPDLSRMAARGRQFGLVFSRERLRQHHRALPVWYVSDGSTPLRSLRTMMSAARATAGDPIWKLTPFIDLVRTDATSPHDFRWEREWRIAGHFPFRPEDIAALVVPKPTGELEPLTGVIGNLLYITPNGDFYWAGDEEELFDEALELLVERFNSDFIPMGDTALPLDRESRYGVAEVVAIIGTWDAAYEVFQELPPKLIESVVDRVERDNGDLWCRRYDVDHAHE